MTIDNYKLSIIKNFLKVPSEGRLLRRQKLPLLGTQGKRPGRQGELEEVSILMPHSYMNASDWCTSGEKLVSSPERQFQGNLCTF